jgi:hypothetical protein
MKNSFYKLDYLLDQAENYENSKDIIVVNSYPELKSLSKHYRKVLSTYVKPSNIDKMLNHFMCNDGEVYIREINFNHKNFYKVIWRVDKALEVIQENNLKPVSYEMSKALKYVDKGKLNYLNAFRAMKNDKPIIVVNYSPCNLDMVIDGNHRVFFNRLKGAKSINAYVLEPKHHLEAMAHDLYRTLYKVHYNLITIMRYIPGEASKEILNTLYKV